MERNWRVVMTVANSSAPNVLMVWLQGPAGTREGGGGSRALRGCPGMWAWVGTRPLQGQSAVHRVSWGWQNGDDGMCAARRFSAWFRGR